MDKIKPTPKVSIGLPVFNGGHHADEVYWGTKIR
jgi:hypothetical protein